MSTGLILETGFINQFDDRLREMIGQKSSKLEGVVNTVPMNSEYKFFDTVGKANVRKDNTKYAAISNFEPTYTRRRLSTDRFLFDMKFDKNTMNKLVNSNDYQQTIVSQMKDAFGRKKDKVIIEALDATVYTGKAGTTAVTASTDGVITIDATGGTTHEKLREAKKKFASKGYSLEDGYDIYHLITEQELDSYEQELEFSNSLYNNSSNVMRDANGQISGALGVKFVVFPSAPEEEEIDEKMLSVASTTRTCFFMLGKKGEKGFPGAITLGLERELTSEFVKIPDEHDSWVLKASMNIGAFREKGTFVQIYNTTIST